MPHGKMVETKEVFCEAAQLLAEGQRMRSTPGELQVCEENRTPAQKPQPCDPASFDADVIFEHVGKFGWFQFRYFICLAYAVMFPTASILVFTFTGAAPQHRCFVDGCDNETRPSYLAGWMDDDFANEVRNNSKEWQCAIPQLNLSMPDCASTNLTFGKCDRWVYDDSIFKSSIVTEFNLVCQDSWKPTFISTLTMLGVLVGALLLGPLPDIIGRRKSVLILSVWMSVFGVALSFSPNYQTFGVLRFLNGMGCMALMQALAIWGLEAMASSTRVKFIFITYCFQSLGNLLTGVLAYFIRDWITLQFCLFIPMIVTICYFFILPESTRWLTVQGRYEEAKEIYKFAARLNGKEIPAHLLLAPQSEAGSKCTQSNAEKSESAWSLTMQIFKSLCLLKRLAILFSAWASAMLSYYGLSYAASHLSSDVHLNYILVILVEIPAYLTGMCAVGFLGRRTIVNVTFVTGGIFCLLAGITPKDQYWLLVTFSLIAKFFGAMQIVTVTMITAEVFPTGARGVTFGLCSTMGKVGGILAPFIASLGTTDRTLPYALFGSVSLVVGAMTLLLPETKGLGMPATIQQAKDMERATLSLRLCQNKETKQKS